MKRQKIEFIKIFKEGENKKLLWQIYENLLSELSAIREKVKKENDEK